MSKRLTSAFGVSVEQLVSCGARSSSWDAGWVFIRLLRAAVFGLHRGAHVAAQGRRGAPFTGGVRQAGRLSGVCGSGEKGEGFQQVC